MFKLTEPTRKMRYKGIIMEVGEMKDEKKSHNFVRHDTIKYRIMKMKKIKKNGNRNKK